MSQTITQRRIIKDYVSPAERVPKDTYYEDMANGFLVLLICGFFAGIVYCFFFGALELLAMIVLAGCFLTLIGLCVWNMADLFIERNEP